MRERSRPRRYLSLVSVASFLALWELGDRLGMLDPVLFSSPSRIAAHAADLSAGGPILGDTLFTLRTFAISLGLSLAVGVAIGVAMGASALCRALLEPFVAIASALPKIVLMPLVTLWIGIGVWANVSLGVLMGSFPILVGVHAGVRSLDPELVRLGRAFGASRSRILRSIVLPAVTPFVVSGLRVAVSYTMVGVLIAEFFASSRGLGHRMVLTMSIFEVDSFYVCLTIVALLTLGGTELVRAFEQRVDGWRPSPRVER